MTETCEVMWIDISTKTFDKSSYLLYLVFLVLPVQQRSGVQPLQQDLRMRTPSLSAAVSNTAHLAHHDLLQAGVAVEAQVPHTSTWKFCEIFTIFGDTVIHMRLETL